MAANSIDFWEPGDSRRRHSQDLSALQRPIILAGARLTLHLLIAVAVLTVAAVGETLTIPIDASISTRDESGACVLKVRVDGSADLMIKAGNLTLRAVHGENPVDEGSKCSTAVPESPLGTFRMVSVQGRGRVLLVENPSGRNGYQAWVRIDDSAAGSALYEVRLSWQLDEGPHEGPGGREDALVLRPRGTPAVWTTETGVGGTTEMPGGRLSSYENDSLRYDSSRSGQLEFRGRVDDAVDFYIRGDRLHALVRSGQLIKVERFRFTQPLPAVTLSSINVSRKDGRGTVELIQRPDSTNDFTAIIRVSDPQSGSDRYHWLLSWAR